MKIPGILFALVCATLLTGTVIAQEPDPQDQEARLDAARARLEAAAAEVAELSAGRGAFMGMFGMGPGGRQRAMLGINIHGVSGDGKVEGVRVLGVSPGSPADAAGLKAGDVITRINGESLAGDSSRDASRKLLDRMDGLDPGEKVAVEYLRDGNNTEAEVETVAMGPGMMNFTMGNGDGNFIRLQPGTGFEPRMGPNGPVFNFTLMHEWGDMELAELSPGLGKYFGTDEGVLVVKAPRDDALQLQDGDVILGIDDRKPKDPNHALRILRSYAAGETLSLEIMRDKRRRTLELTMPQDRPVHENTMFWRVPAAPPAGRL